MNGKARVRGGTVVNVSRLSTGQKMNNLDHQNAIDAVDVLNDFVGDLVTGTNLFREYDQQYRRDKLPFELMIPIQRMCLSYIVLALSKWTEAYDKYHAIFPSEFSNIYKRLNADIRKRGILEFRNKCVGHIWDKKTNKPLTHSEVMGRLSIITEGSIHNFLNWINNLHDNTFPKTVVSIIEKIKDHIVIKHGIHPDEVIQR